MCDEYYDDDYGYGEANDFRDIDIEPERGHYIKETYGYDEEKENEMYPSGGLFWEDRWDRA